MGFHFQITGPIRYSPQYTSSFMGANMVPSIKRGVPLAALRWYTLPLLLCFGGFWDFFMPIGEETHKWLWLPFLNLG
jgi:hypothetical protein